MPKKEVDYSQALIYKLVCQDLDIKEVYVGSTTNFRIRKNSHKTKCGNEKSPQHNLCVYTTVDSKTGI